MNFPQHVSLLGNFCGEVADLWLSHKIIFWILAHCLCSWGERERERQTQRDREREREIDEREREQFPVDRVSLNLRHVLKKQKGT